MGLKLTRTRLLVFLLIALLIFVISGLSFSWLVEDLCLGEFLPGSVSNLPAYITDVWPRPGGELSSDCYTKSVPGNIMSANRRGIQVSIKTDSIAASVVSDTKHGPFYDRVSLFVDGKQVSNETRDYLDLGPAFLPPKGVVYPYELGLYYEFSWTPLLISGDHSAKLMITTQSGKPIEYEWHFTLR